MKGSPVPELSFLSAPYRGWTRAGEKRVQDNLHAHAQNEPIKSYYAACVNVSRNSMPFTARAQKKNHFLWRWCCGKKINWNVVYRGLYFYQQRVRVFTLFPNIESLQKFLKGKSNPYKWLICIMQRVHFQVWVGVFNCQQMLTEISFVVFDIVVKKTNRMSFSVALMKFHWFGINWQVFYQS